MAFLTAKFPAEVKVKNKENRRLAGAETSYAQSQESFERCVVM